MEWLSFSRGRWYEDHEDAYVHIPARDVGRLDEKYLPGVIRPAFHVDAWYVWGLACAHHRVLPPDLAIDRNFMDSKRWQLAGGFGDHPDDIAVECFDP